MTFDYPYLTDEAFEEQRKKLEPGIYNFEVVDAKEGYSRTSGNPMMTIDLKVFDNNGNIHIIRDYLVGKLEVAYKIKQFWQSVGKPEKYNSSGKTEESDFLSRCGKVKTKLEKGEDGIREFPRVSSYVVDKEKNINNQKVSNGANLETSKIGIEDDYVPF